MRKIPTMPDIIVTRTIAAKGNNANGDHAWSTTVKVAECAASGSLAMEDETFAAVDGFEWFVRTGPSGPIEVLTAVW